MDGDTEQLWGRGIEEIELEKHNHLRKTKTQRRWLAWKRERIAPWREVRDINECFFKYSSFTFPFHSILLLMDTYSPL